MSSKVFEIIAREEVRQNETIELIASENFVSDQVMEAMGSCLTNKYAEGYPNKRYYGGCESVDKIEKYCIEKWREVFRTDYHVNVQPHSGSQANMAAYQAGIMQNKIYHVFFNCHRNPLRFSQVRKQYRPGIGPGPGIHWRTP